MQPFETFPPINSGDEVLCIAIAGRLPLKSSKTSEC